MSVETQDILQNNVTEEALQLATNAAKQAIWIKPVEILRKWENLREKMKTQQHQISNVFQSSTRPRIHTNCKSFNSGHWTFIDEYTKYAVVKCMKNKSQVLDNFKEYVAENGTPKTLRTDNGTEYTSEKFR